MSFPALLGSGGGGVASSLISALAPATQMSALTDTFSVVKETAKDKKGLSGISDIFNTIKDISSTPFNIISAILDLMSAIGVVEPILDLITMLIEILGAAIMEKMMPAFMKLMEAIMESGLIDLIIIIGELIGTVLAVVFDALIITLEKMSPLFETLTDILGTEGMQTIIIILAKILGTLIMVGFIPLILIIYALGAVVAFVMDIIAGIVAFFTGQEAPGSFKNIEAWNEGFGGLLLDTVAAIGVGIGELWATDYGEREEYVDTEGRIPAGDIIIYVEETEASAEDIATEIEYRRSLGR